MSDLKQGIWSNWSGFQKAKPQQILQPPNIQELQSIVRDYQKITTLCCDEWSTSRNYSGCRSN